MTNSLYKSPTVGGMAYSVYIIHLSLVVGPMLSIQLVCPCGMIDALYIIIHLLLVVWPILHSFILGGMISAMYKTHSSLVS